MESLNKKNVIWNIIGSTFSAFNSLLFTIIVTRINGIDDAGIFTYCFATSCLLYFIGNYCGRAFQVTDTSGKNYDTDYIYNRIITCILMMIVAIVFSLIKKYDLNKSLILIILSGYKCLEAFAESVYAIIQKNNQLYKVGISLFAKAILSIIIFAITDYITKSLAVSCLTIVVINVIGILFYDLKNLKKVNFNKSTFNKNAIINIFKIGFFTFVLTFLGTYLINTSRYAIDDLSTNSFQTIYGIIIMPATFMGIIGQYIIQPALVSLSNYIKDKNYKNLKDLIIKLVEIVLLIGIVVIIVAFLLEKPVLELVYNVQLENYVLPMMIIIVGSIFYALSILLSTILIAMRKTKSQAVTYLIVAIISTLLAYSLVEKMEIIGASLTYSITMIIVTVAFAIYTIIKMKKYSNEWKENK